MTLTRLRPIHRYITDMKRFAVSKSKFINKHFWIIAIALIAIMIGISSIVPVSFNFSSPDRVSRIYYADNLSIAHQQLIEKFNREYAGKIEVIPVDLPFTKFSTNERKELLARSLRSKSNRIDVFSVDVIWVPRFARWSEPLHRYFSKAETDCIIAEVLKSCYTDTALYALPHYSDIGVLYYRSDLLKRLPDAEEVERKLQQSITWEEFIELGGRFPQSKNAYYLFAADNFEGLICSYIEGIVGLDQSLFRNDSLLLDTPDSRKVVQLLVDLVHEHHLTSTAVTKYDEFDCYLDAFQNNTVFFRGWPGFLRHFKRIFDGIEATKYIKTAPLPHFSGGDPAFVFGGWNLMVSKYSNYKDEAVTFIKFLLREENQKQFYRSGGYLPVIQSVYEDTAYCAKEPDLQFYRKLMESGVHRPYLVEYTKISDIISYYVHLAIKKEITVAECLQRATALVNDNYVLIK